MSNPVDCARCGRSAPGVSGVPYGGAVGDEIRSRICQDCWNEWMRAEVMVINELRLNFMDPAAQDQLLQHMREFLQLDAPAAGG